MHILQVIRDYYANAYWIKSFTTQNSVSYGKGA